MRLKPEGGCKFVHVLVFTFSFHVDYRSIRGGRFVEHKKKQAVDSWKERNPLNGRASDSPCLCNGS